MEDIKILIDKQTYGTIYASTRKLSGYNPQRYYVLSTDNLMIEGELQMPLVKYIKGFIETGTLYNFTIAELDVMNETEKSELDEQLRLESELQLYIDSFNGFKYKVTTNLEISDELNPYYSIYKIGLLENNPRIIIYDTNDNATHIVSYWNEIKQPFMDILTDETILASDNSRMFILEINPNEN